MVAAFDTNVLCLLLHPDADVPNDPSTGKPVSRAQDRMAYLVEQFRETGSRILIPTPVLAEFLTFAPPDYLAVINTSAHFEVAAFDQRAAIESARAVQRAKSGPGKKLGMAAGWQKIKVDWQIAAIAKVGGADTLYTTDSDLGTIAAEYKIKTIHVADLDLPPSDSPLFDGIEAEDSDASTAADNEGENDASENQNQGVKVDDTTESEAADGAPEDSAENQQEDDSARVSPASDPSTSTEPPPPSSQSADDAQESASPPEPDPPSAPHDDPS